MARGGTEPSPCEADEEILLGFQVGAKHAPLAQKGLAVFAKYALVQAERGKEALGCRELEEWTLGLGSVPLGWMEVVFRVQGRGHILGEPPGISGLGSAGRLNMSVLL